MKDVDSRTREEFREGFFEVFSVYPDDEDREHFEEVVGTVLARLLEEADAAQLRLIESREAIADNPLFLQYEKAREESRQKLAAYKRANAFVGEPFQRFIYGT